MRYIFLQTMILKVGLIEYGYRRIDNPEVTIQPVLRFFPLPRAPSALGPKYKPQLDGNGAPIASPTTAYIRSVQRHPSAVVRPLALRKQPMAPRRFREDYRRKPCRVPLKVSSYPKLQITDSQGAYNRYSGVRRQEDSLEAHTRAIEDAIHAAHKLRAQCLQHATVQVGGNSELTLILHRIQFIAGELRNYRIEC